MSIPDALRNPFAKGYGTVHPIEVTALAEEGAALLDVREPDEWLAGDAPEARHIGLNQLAARAGELPTDRKVVTVCRSGMRSAQAAALLAAQGRQVDNLT